MDNTNQTPKLIETINKGVNGTIVLAANPSVDAIAAATALYLGLTKAGKNVSLTCSTPVNSDLHGSDKIGTKLVNGGDNLVIAFPYEDGSIDKVDYNIKDMMFNLIITPRPGYPKLDPSKVQYSYSGGSVDFIITIDTPNLNSLGKLYKENEKEFSSSAVINIDRHLVNDFYGRVNIVDKTASSTSQIVLRAMKDLQIAIDKDMATNLYTGLVAATNNFTSYSVNADTFEAAADLLKLGAIKKPVRNVQGGGQPPQQMGRPFLKTMPNPFSQPQQAAPTVTNQPAQQIQPPSFPQAQPFEAQEPVDNEGTAEAQPENQGKQAAPQDWLKPKIFRGGGLV